MLACVINILLKAVNYIFSAQRKLLNLKAKSHCQVPGDADICKYLSGLMDDAWP